MKTNDLTRRAAVAGCALFLAFAGWSAARAQTLETYDPSGDLIAQAAETAAASPTIAAQPSTLLGQVGATYSFSVVASGPGPLTYQWYRGYYGSASPVAGATGSTLLIANAQSGDFTSYSPPGNFYWVTVSNASGTTTSALAALYLDSNGSGLPDWWQILHFGTLGVPPNGDADGDGVTNLQEYLDGTDPNDPNSHDFILTLTGDSSLVTVSPAGSRFAPGTTVMLQAPSVAGRQFIGWTGDVTSTGSTLTLTMNRNYTVSAAYTALPVDTLYAPPSFTGTGAAPVFLGTQSDGQVLVAGNFAAVNGVARYSLARVNTDGTLDADYRPPVLLATNAPRAIVAAALQPDDKVLVAGAFPSNGTSTSPYLVRLNTDGSVDTGFSAALAMFTNIYQVAVQPADGKIVVVYTIGSGGNSQLERLNADGSFDSSFTVGLPANYFVASVVCQGDGKIVFNGGTSSYYGGTINQLGRLNGDGSLDASYAPPLTANNNLILRLRNDGELYVATGGNLGTNSSQPIKVALVKTDGTLDPAFATGDSAKLNTPRSAVVLPDGGIVTDGGAYISYDPNTGKSPYEGLARFAANGTLNPSLFSAVTETNVDGTMTLDGTGALLVGGYFTTVGGVSHLGLARLDLNSGAVDPAYTASLSQTSNVTGIVLQPDGTAIVYGGFNVVNGVYCPAIARLAPDSTLDTSFNPGAVFHSTVLAAAIQPDNDVVVGGPSYLARINSNGTFDSGFVLNGSGLSYGGAIQAVALQPDGSILAGGSFSTVNGVAHGNVARFDHYGGTDDSFAPATNGQVDCIVVQPDGRILVGGNYTQMNGVAMPGLARLNADGSLDTGFNPPALGPLLGLVRCMVLRPNAKIVAGGTFYQGSSSTPGGGMIQLNADGSADTAFNNTFAGTFGSYAYIYALALQEDGGLVVGGIFSVNRNANLSNLIRVGPSGLLDPTAFAYDAPNSGGASPYYQVSAIAAGTNGGVTVGGYFTLLGNQDRLAYSRLLTTDNIVTGDLYVAPNGDGATLSVYPISYDVPLLNVGIEQSTDGGVTYQVLGDATVDHTGLWSYVIPTLPAGPVYYRAVVANYSQEQARTSSAGPLGRPPDVTSALSATAQVGAAFSYAATATGTLTYFYADGLPTWAAGNFNNNSGVLTISGTPTTPGVFGLTLHPGNLYAIGSAPLTLTVYNRYQAWTAANFTAAQLQNPAVSGPNGDATGAGIPNLLRYALGIPANRPGVAGLPTLSQTQVGASRYLTLTYTHDLLVNDVALSVEVSGDLATGGFVSGAAYTTEISRTNNGDGTETVVTRDNTAMSAASRRFIRLRATLQQ